jgi:hypothetical protein
MSTQPSIRRRTCHGCGNAVPVRLVPPAAVGAVAVDVLDCPMCDYLRCKGCNGTPVRDRRAKRCPAGHRLD